ncbi:MAG TPA: tripartite tricarboxylate transporter substrate binding protein [Burkholderiales bacterium]|nr:tripartite tricarboxylate transporter substrate binding protein [Burkholderiales bacterium]
MKVKLVAILLAAAAPASAAPPTYFDYPTKPVRIVVGATPGETNDLLARIVAPSLANFLKRPFLINNEPGGNGSRAATLVAKAPPDGHMVLLVSASFATSVSLYPNPGYHPERDFTPIARLASFPQVLIVQSSLKLGTLPEFISLVRATPGRVAIASTGTGTISHLTAELMKLQAGWLNALHVPYRGSAQALAGLLGNHVQALITNASTAQVHLRTGRVRALAVATAERLPSLPNVPTFAQAGVPGVEASGWTGIVAAAGTPYEPIVRLSVAIAEAMSTPAVVERFASQGAQTVREGPEDFGRYLHHEVERWAKVVKASGIGPE